MTTSDKKVIVITGGSGLLGLNWGHHISDRYQPVLGLHSREIHLDGILSRHLAMDSTTEFLSAVAPLKPVAVIHTAGMTSIEGCEENPDLARHINVELSRHVCESCRELGVPMIHISTDNLFDGTLPFVSESQAANPVNVYGQTKAEAEQVIQSIYDNVLIIRTNFYGWGPPHKQSFSDSIISALKTRKKIFLFKDVFYTPIIMDSLIDATQELIDLNESGVFNIVGDERLTKYDFGIQLARHFGLDESLIKEGWMAERTDIVQRPMDMSLSNTKICKVLNKQMGNVAEQLNLLARTYENRVELEISKEV